MASSMLALKRPLSSNIDLRRTIHPLGASIAVSVPPLLLSRSINANAQLPDYGYGDYQRSFGLDRPAESFDSGRFSKFPSNATKPPSPPLSRTFTTNAQHPDYGYGDYGRAFGHDLPADYSDSGKCSMFLVSPRPALTLMDNFVEYVLPPATHYTGAGFRRSWDCKETAEALHLRLDMPGLAKECIKITAEQDALVINGEEDKEAGGEYTAAKYSGRIDLPEKIYKTNATKAEMKNGVPKVSIPKVKEEERTDVYHVNVE